MLIIGIDVSHKSEEIKEGTFYITSTPHIVLQYESSTISIALIPTENPLRELMNK